MLVTTKLRIHLIIAVVALLLKIVIFSSPGWAVFRFPVDQYIYDPTSVDPLPEDEPGQPVAMAKRDTHEEKKDLGLMKPMYMPQKREYEMNIRIGLWYFVTCIHRCHDHDKDEEHPKDMVLDEKNKDTKQDEQDSSEEKNDDRHKHHKRHHRHHCAVSTYEKAEKNAHELPKEMAPARIVYKHLGALGKMGLCEYRIETVLGLLMSLIGVIFTGFYKRSFAEKRCHGLTACLSLLLSGSLYAVAVGKTATTIFHAKAVIAMNNWEMLKMPVPWCLIIGALAAVLTIFVGVCHIFTLSRERSDPNNCYVIKTHHVKGSFPFHTLAPPGYEPKLTLLNPPEEAGPLPEKQAM